MGFNMLVLVAFTVLAVRCLVSAVSLTFLARAVVLPPYSPDFIPIENAFSKLKAMLRAKVERTINALRDTVGTLVGRFSPCECANYFSAAGYEPD